MKISFLLSNKIFPIFSSFEHPLRLKKSTFLPTHAMRSVRSLAPVCTSSTVTRTRPLSSRPPSPFWLPKFPHSQATFAKPLAFAGVPSNSPNLRLANKHSSNHSQTHRHPSSVEPICPSSRSTYHRSWRSSTKFTAPQSPPPWARTTRTCLFIKNLSLPVFYWWRTTVKNLKRSQWGNFTKHTLRFARNEAWPRRVCPRLCQWRSLWRAVVTSASGRPKSPKIVS